MIISAVEGIIYLRGVNEILLVSNFFFCLIWI